MELRGAGLLNAKVSRVYKHSSESCWFLIDLTLALIACRITGFIEWSWYLVLSPTLFLLTLFSLYVIAVVMLLQWVNKSYDRA